MERHQVGGSWTTTSFLGYDRVETACHLLERDPEVYSYLEQVGVELVDMVPEPTVHFSRTMAVPYVSAIVPLVSLALLPASAGRHLARSRGRHDTAGHAGSTIWQDLRRRPRAALRQARGARMETGPLRYFDGGVGAMLERLEANVEAAGCRVSLGQGVEQVAVSRSEGPISLVTSSGERREADRLVFSSGSRLGNVEICGEQVETWVEGRKHLHLLLAFPPATLRPVSYAHFPYHRRIHRVTDVTPYARRRSGSEEVQLVLVNLRADSGQVPDVDYVVRFLDTHRFLVRTGRVLDHTLLEFESRNAGAPLRALTELDPFGRLVLLPSYGDLVRSMRTAGLRRGSESPEQAGVVAGARRDGPGPSSVGLVLGAAVRSAQPQRDQRPLRGVRRRAAGPPPGSSGRTCAGRGLRGRSALHLLGLRPGRPLSGRGLLPPHPRGLPRPPSGRGPALRTRGVVPGGRDLRPHLLQRARGSSSTTTSSGSTSPTRPPCSPRTASSSWPPTRGVGCGLPTPGATSPAGPAAASRWRSPLMPSASSGTTWATGTTTRRSSRRHRPMV